MIEVGPLADGEEDAWDAFLLANPGGLLYQSTSYRDLLLDLLDCEAEYLVARQGGEIRGVLPIMWAGDAGGRVCNSLPFYGSHGAPLAADPDAESALIQAWDERAARAETATATMVANPFAGGARERPRHNLEDERISQATELPGADPEELMAIYSKNARRDVRRAERRGVEVEIDQDRLPDLGRMHIENITAIGGMPKPESFFAAVPRHFRAGEDFDVWVASLRDVMIAGLLVFYFNEVAEYFTPAADRSHQADEPMALILHRAMTESASRGCRVWNWGGTWSSQQGVHRFKRKWGAVDTRYRYFVQLNDESLLDSTPEELGRRFPHFYLAPFSALRSQEAVR